MAKRKQSSTTKTQTETAKTEDAKVEQTQAPTVEEPKTEETQPPVEETNKPAAKEEPAAETKPADKATAKATPELPTAGQHVLTGVVEYAEAMAPKVPQNEQSIQQNQRRLKTGIDTLLRLNAEDFGPTLKAVVATIGEHRDGAFNERYLFRGFPGMRLPTKERTRFELLLSLLTTAADVKNFSDVKKHVSLDTLFKYVTDNDQQQKLAGVFK